MQAKRYPDGLTHTPFAIVKLLLIPLVLYLIVVALMYVGQRSLLYLPGHRAADPDDLATQGLRHWPDESAYRGYLSDPPSARATIVIFHGNAGDAIDRRYYIDALGFLNVRVILAEYPGYGARDGRPSESALVTDARETLAKARQQFADDPLFVVGESLGAAVAAGAVAPEEATVADPAVDGLLLLTPWNALSAVAAYHYRFLPVDWLLKDRYPSADRLGDAEMMTVVVVAERDEVVPARFGRALFDSLSEPRELVVVTGAGHNDWFARVDQQWWRGIFERMNAAALDRASGVRTQPG